MRLKILHHEIDSGYNIKFGYVDRATEHDVGMGLFRRIGNGLRSRTERLSRLHTVQVCLGSITSWAGLCLSTALHWRS